MPTPCSGSAAPDREDRIATLAAVRPKGERLLTYDLPHTPCEPSLPIGGEFRYIRVLMDAFATRRAGTAPLAAPVRGCAAARVLLPLLLLPA